MRQQITKILKVVGVILLGGFILGGLLAFGARYIRFDQGTSKFKIGDDTRIKGKLYVDGDVGIGTTRPGAKLHISTADASPYLIIENTESSSVHYPGIIIENYGGTTFGGHGWIAKKQARGTKASPIALSPNTVAGGIGSYAHDGTTFKDVARIYGGTGPNFGPGDQEGFFSFQTGDGPSCTEKMRITHNGRVGIGTTNPTHTLHVNGNARKTSGGGYWDIFSDIRLKENILPINSALDKVMQLKGVTYMWKDPSKHNGEDGRYMGFNAQDVEEVIPEWVKLGADGYKLLNPIGVNALFVEAIKELKAENEALKARINVLETRIEY